jgi:hypothetical protein
MDRSTACAAPFSPDAAPRHDQFGNNVVPTNRKTVEILHVKHQISLLKFSPYYFRETDLDAAIESEIARYGPPDHDVGVTHAAAAIADRIRKLSYTRIAATMPHRIERLRVYRFYMSKSRDLRYRHVRKARLTFPLNDPHRNAVLFLGIAGLLTDEARSLMPSDKIDFDKVLTAINVAMGSRQNH